MSDDEMPELEDLSEQLNEIRKARGIDEKNIPKDIKIGVINEKNNSNNKVNIPISTSPPQPQPQPQPQPKPQPEQKPKEKTDNKRDEDNFGFGLFKRGFLKRHNFSEEDNKTKKEPKKEPKVNNINNNNNPPKKEEPVDLTHIKSNPGTTTKTQVLNNFNKDLKSNQDSSKPNLLNNLANNKQQWLNQELLMKIAQNPNLMRCFMDPRFSTVIQELQTNPQECLKKYGNNPEFSTFIKEFSALMGDHFNNLAKNPLQGNPNYNNPEVQEIINDPKIKPILERLQKEGKIDMNEIMRDPYVSSKFKVLIDKKILNIQKMD